VFANRQAGSEARNRSIQAGARLRALWPKPKRFPADRCLSVSRMRNLKFSPGGETRK